MWIIIVVVVIGIILFLTVGNKSLAKNNMFLFNKWKELPSDLSKKGINQTSQILIDSIHRLKKENDYIPEKVISVDSQAKKLVVSYLSNIKRDEKADIVSCDFQHDVFDFNQIKGGKIVALGESAKSVGTGVGASIGNTSMVGGVSSSNVTSYIEKLEYVIKLNNIDYPEYTITFIDRKESTTSLWYERHYKRAEKLNSLVEMIAENNNKAV